MPEKKAYLTCFTDFQAARRFPLKKDFPIPGQITPANPETNSSVAILCFGIPLHPATRNTPLF